MIDNIREYVLACAEAGDMEPLAYQLEFTTHELTKGEREFLARYIRGEIKRDAKRPKRSPRVRWEALHILDVVLCEERQGGTRDYAIKEAARACGISEATVRRRLDDLHPGDEAGRRERLNHFHEICDDLNVREPGRGEFVRESRLRAIASGEAFKAGRVSKSR